MKIVKHIPNTITSMNLLCGVLGVIATLRGDINIAFCLMLAAAVFDFCDGLSARLLNAYSDLGKQLDSLADMVSFGILPSIMLYKLMEMANGESVWCYIPLVIAVFSALRLAKFNTDSRQGENFLGLPTPVCAMWCGSLIYAADHGVMSMANMLHDTMMIPVSAVILSLLLTSEIPMFSFKFKKDSAYNRIRIYFAVFTAAIAAATLILKINWSYIILITSTCYILLNVINALFASCSCCRKK